MRALSTHNLTTPRIARRTTARAFTVVEVMIVLLIMSIISVMCLDTISGFEFNQRAERAAREARGCFRYARSLAMSTGKKAKVVVNSASGTLSIYWQSNGTTYDATPVTTGMVAGGQWVLSLSSRELVGTTVSISPAATTYFEYSALGNCGQAGTITFSCGSRRRSLVVAAVGDPSIP